MYIYVQSQKQPKSTAAQDKYCILNYNKFYAASAIVNEWNKKHFKRIICACKYNKEEQHITIDGPDFLFLV